MKVTSVSDFLKMVRVSIKFAEEVLIVMLTPSFQSRVKPPLRPVGGTVNKFVKPKSLTVEETESSLFLVSMRNRMSGEIVRCISLRRRTVRGLLIP
ncbi:unnamed protein product [Arabidopsis halleri]